MMFYHILAVSSPITGDSFPTWPLLISILAALAIVTFLIFKRHSPKVVTEHAEIDFDNDLTTQFTADKISDYMQPRKYDDYDAGFDNNQYEDEFSDEFRDNYELDKYDFEIESDREEDN